MEKFFEWFNERTQREKLLLILAPLGLTLVLWLNFIQPLLSEKRKLEEELQDLRATQILIAKKLSLRKRVKELKTQVQVKTLTLEDLLTAADKYEIFIEKFEKVNPRGIVVQKRGKKILFYKPGGKKNSKTVKVKSGVKVKFTSYNLSVIASEDKVKAFIKYLFDNYFVVLSGFYKGCLGQRNFLRRVSAPLVCDSGRMYRNLICKEDELSNYRYILSFVTITAEGK